MAAFGDNLSSVTDFMGLQGSPGSISDFGAQPGLNDSIFVYSTNIFWAPGIFQAMNGTGNTKMNEGN